MAFPQRIYLTSSRTLRRRRWLVGWVSFLISAMVLVTSAASSAQSLDQSPLSEVIPQSVENLLPSSLQDLIAFSSDLSAAPVDLDGRTIFYVAAPAAGDAAGSEVISAARRSWEIEQRLREFARQDYQIESLDVTSAVEEVSNQPIIYVNGNFLMTVTAADAQLRGLQDLTIRAEELTRLIRSALVRFKQERQPQFLRQQIYIALGGLTIAIFLSLAIASFQHILARRRRRCDSAMGAIDTASDAQAANPAAESSTALREQMHRRQQRNILDVQRRLLILGQVVLWISALVLALGLFPYTRWLQPILLDILKLPVKLVALFAVLYSLIRLGNVLIDRFCIALQDRPTWVPERSQRLSLRLSTFAQIAKSIMASALIATGILVALSLVGVEIAPLLAGAGIVGLAISFASQSLIKDVINGFLIALEDQYGVGDVVVIGDVSGFVETMNLRITQLRNEEGRLITIPNGQITVVQNLSKEWSRVDVTIAVDPSADLDRAIAVIDHVAHEMSQDSRWQSLILEPPLMLGVDRLDYFGAAIRVWIKTLPLKQWDVAREYRRRLKLAFDHSNIPIGRPHQFVQINPPDTPVPVDSPLGNSQVNGAPDPAKSHSAQA
ncbi:MAG: mechanosensitive ion channel family protein [Leptolyngbyaceae cyanobacterium SM1_1_3]|nr:mechanosensitive ion channel family protein [Leptolyngbyaceae cyanobacterium SM1_1_3]NJN02367.1 mechanosensitive ion channel family protein [Leptolyngbyaceae cyanobacterium RM1_1_2]NJO10401.1 mechanosensitive ion channel family protein [Leptolyngbyaceae cyanobacterium SL_1_1]